MCNCILFVCFAVFFFAFVSLKLLLTDKQTQFDQRMEDWHGQIKWETRGHTKSRLPVRRRKVVRPFAYPRQTENWQFCRTSRLNGINVAGQLRLPIKMMNLVLRAQIGSIACRSVCHCIAIKSTKLAIIRLVRYRYTVAHRLSAKDADTELQAPISETGNARANNNLYGQGARASARGKGRKHSQIY